MEQNPQRQEALYETDTIAAIATPVGVGGIGIIRISGPGALAAAEQFFRPAGGNQALADRHMTYGWAVDAAGDIIDEVMTVYMQGPRSYTAEDVVEVQCHGGPVLLQRILARILTLGPRLAEPGEFTKRAFLHGRLDLSQAEAVIDLIQAKSTAGARAAVDQLVGRYSAVVKKIRETLTDVLVDLTVNIDYPDEDIELLTYQRLEQALTRTCEDIAGLLATADRGRMLKDGLRVAIIGKPNVGKSSLLNGLLREERAIVTEIPGTTRDSIEETFSLGGIPILLTDTAGIRRTADTVEKLGVEKSRSLAHAADVVLLVLDGSRPLDEEDEAIWASLQDKQLMVLINKADLPQSLSPRQIGSRVGADTPVLSVSAATGAGLADVEEALRALVYGGKVAMDNTVLVTSLRHKALLEQALASAQSAAEAAALRQPFELIEVDVNQCFQELGQITGDNVDGEILDAVFSRFCLGK